MTSLPADSSPSASTAPAPRSSAGSVMVALGILLSRLAGFARERAIAHYLGNSEASGAFRAALRIPNLLQNLFGEGVLSASFIPVYARLVAQGRHEDARRVAGAVASLLALATSLLTVLGVLFAPQLTALIAPGFDGHTRVLTIRLTQVLFPGVGLLVLSAWCLGILNSHRRMFLSYAAPVLWNAAMIAALVAWGTSLLGPLEGSALAVRLAWGAVLGSALQLVVQVPPALRAAGGLRPRLGRHDPDVAQVVSRFGPMILARGAVQLSAYLDQVLASFLGARAVSAMGFAQTIALLPVSLFGMSIAAAELPEMSRLTGSASDVGQALRDRLVPALRRVTFLVVPSAVALVALGRDLAGGLFQSGTFEARDSQAVALILAGSAVGLLAVTRARLYSSALYALGETRAPLRYALLRVGLSGVLGWVVTFPLRSAIRYDAITGAALVVATAGVAGWIEYLLLRGAVWGRVGRLPSTVGLDARIWAVAIVSGLVSAGVGVLVPTARPLLHALATLPLFAVLYVLLARLARIPEVDPFIDRARRLLRAR